MDDSVIGAHSGRLPNLGLLRFSGADALGFLQGQISNDTGRLAAGAALLCACSNAQGRVVAVMTLLPHSSGVVAILPSELLGPTAEHLRKFVLRSKVRIEDAGADLVVAGQHGSGALRAAGLPVPPVDASYREALGIGVARLHDPHERYWLIGPGARLAELGLDGAGTGRDRAAAAALDWKLADIHAGLPQVYAASSGLYVAQMLNLDRVDGISFTKGCYTGQEIIARTQNLGRIKRRMFRVALHGEPGIGQMVRLADGRSGRVTEFARGPSGYEALAVLPLDVTAESASGISAALLALPYSLSGA
jgi:folate-binding protein YgfZ